MAVELKQYIELRGDNPMLAVIAGTNLKAHLVANLAFNDGPEKSAKHYKLSLAAVYAAMSFCHHNAEAIKNADEAIMAKLWASGMKNAQEEREEILRRQKK